MHHNVHNDIKKNNMSWFTCSHQTLLQFQNDQSCIKNYWYIYQNSIPHALEW